MKENKIIINLGLIGTLLFCLAFACQNGENGGSGQTNDPASVRPAASETGPPAEAEVKETFRRFFGNPDVEFESIQIKPDVVSYTSNLGVAVHGYPVKIASVTRGGYGVKNGTRTAGVYYFYRDDFGEWQIFQGDSITRTDF